MLRNEVAQIEIMRCIQPFAHVVIAELEEDSWIRLCSSKRTIISQEMLLQQLCPLCERSTGIAGV
jgi:hypothetical protein